MKTTSPQRVANEITLVLRAAGVDSFPVDVRTVALEISRAKYPHDAIAVIKGDVLPGFEGALSPAPAGKEGWGIFYNSGMASRGRINFTLGHEFGHYLLHRRAYPGGFQCSTEDMASWGSEYAQRESEANAFAATLLMPLDDFRTQIDGRERPNFDRLGACAERYDVSLMAATLRWLQYTSRRSLLVVSRDGFILWSRASQSALRSHLYVRTRDRPPIPIPIGGAAEQAADTPACTREIDPNVWCDLPCTEHMLRSESYDFTRSLLHFPDFDPESEVFEHAAHGRSARMVANAANRRHVEHIPRMK